MEALKHKVINSQGKEVGSLDLNPGIFGAKVHKTLVHETVRWQRAKARSGTHATLSRSMMKGGGKKPWKQKGTGRARAGSIISPLWVGGAIVFGPQPRDYEFRLPKRSRRQALCSALSDKVAQGTLLVLDELKLESGKTKDMNDILVKLGVADNKCTLLVLNKDNDATWKAARNLPCVKTILASAVNVYDLLNAGSVLITKEGISVIEERLKAKA